MRSRRNALRAANADAARRWTEDDLRRLDSSIKKNTALTKKLGKTIGAETLDGLKRDVASTNASKYVAENARAVAFAATIKSSPGDVAAAAELVSEMHRMYFPEFGEALGHLLPRAICPDAPVGAFANLASGKEKRSEKTALERDERREREARPRGFETPEDSAAIVAESASDSLAQRRAKLRLLAEAHLVGAVASAKPVFATVTELIRGATDSLKRDKERFAHVLGSVDHLLVDEYQDINDTYYGILEAFVQHGARLTVVGDDAQSIYKKRSLKFPLSSAGIEARGRTTILRLNYRNTREILSFAYDFAKDFLQAQDADDDHIPLIAPEVAGSSGPPPQFRKFDNFNDEAYYIARCVRKWHVTGQPLNNIAVIYGHHGQAETLQRALRVAGVPCSWLKTSADKKRYDANADSVALLTRQSSKGLEFETVVLGGLGGLKDDEKSLEYEVRLLYVGVTRARQKLMMTGSGNNWFTVKLSDLNAVMYS